MSGLRDGLGKAPIDFLKSSVFKNLGARRESVLVGPGSGLDNAVISLDSRRVLLATGDPVSVIPALGMRRSAWLSVHLVASDLATSGQPAQFAIFEFNFPPEMELSAAGRYIGAVGEECGRLGIAVVGGHTGRYPGSGYTVVGGGTMFAVGARGAYVTPAMARPGDAVVVTKGAAIGATAVLSLSFPSTLARRAGDRVVARAGSLVRRCSTVRDAAAAASLGLHTAVTSMHDATEGGIMGGLHELSAACGFPVIADPGKVIVPDESAAVCGAFGLDPLTTTSEGALIVTCRRSAADGLVGALARAGIASSQVGRVGRRAEGDGLMLAPGGSSPSRHTPGPDAYWDVYSAAVREGLE